MIVSLACPACKQTALHESEPERLLACPACQTEFRPYTEAPVAALVPAPDLPVTDVAVTESIIGFLDRVETAGKRMIVGTAHFLAFRMPHWLARQLFNLGRIAVKALRVAAVFGLWFCLTLLPVALLVAGWLPGGWPVTLLAVAWSALALSGSVWGLIYVRRRVSLREGFASPEEPEAPIPEAIPVSSP
jgi:hypothetical protein